jgi:hypothetical protein
MHAFIFPSERAFPRKFHHSKYVYKIAYVNASLARIFISSLSSFEAKFNKFYYHRYKMTEDFLIQDRPQNIMIFKSCFYAKICYSVQEQRDEKYNEIYRDS